MLKKTPGITALSQYITAEIERETQRITDALDQYGFGYEFVEAYDVQDIEVRSQVRSAEKTAPPERVRMFAEAMKSGNPIPPGVITSDGYTIDNNTRLQAAHKVKRTHLPMFVLDVAMEGAEWETEGKLVALGCQLNNHGPQPLDKPAKLMNVTKLLLHEYSVERICEIVGVDKATVYAARKVRDTRHKMTESGFDTENAKTVKLFVNIASLHMEVFKAFAQLALDAGMNYRDVMDLVKVVRKAASDEAQLDIIAKERALPERAEAIEQMRTTGGAPNPPLARQLKRALGGVVKFIGEKPEVLVERNHELALEYLTVMQQTVDMLGRIMPLQQRIVGPSKPKNNNTRARRNS